MVSLRHNISVTLEMEFEIVAAEFETFRHNADDLPLEKLITIWGDQIKRVDLKARVKKMETPSERYTRENNPRRKRTRANLG